MNKILGIFGLLIFVCLFTTVLSRSFDSASNLYNVTRWSALFGIISIGVAFVIITGGIDLSIGSIVCLGGCLLSIFIMEYGWSVYLSVALVLLVSLLLGLLHGLLITKLQLQPFVVTLCGLLVYRGFARWFAADQPQGFKQEHNEGLRQLAIGKPWHGYETNLATMLAMLGVLFVVYFSARAVLAWTNKSGDPWKSLIGLGFSLLIALANSSQFWGGDQNLVLNIAGQRFALAPGPLMFSTGLALFLPASIAVIGAALRHNLVRTLRPTIVMALCAILFSYVAWNVAPMFDKISPGDPEIKDYGWITASGGSVRNLIMLFVFIATGALMAAIGWLTSVLSSIKTSTIQALLVIVIASGVMWLVGMTKLPETAVPMPLLILIACAIVASVFLNQTIFGRYLLALGRNEEAARYSGINTDRMIILAYVICAGMAGLGAILFALDINNMQPATHGNIYELYAIAGAVLGGCSLRGGEGTIVGVVIGAAVMRVLYNAINTLGIDTRIDWVVIGVVILTGVIADEVVKRIVAARRAQQQAQTQ